MNLWWTRSAVGLLLVAAVCAALPLGGAVAPAAMRSESHPAVQLGEAAELVLVDISSSEDPLLDEMAPAEDVVAQDHGLDAELASLPDAPAPVASANSTEEHVGNTTAPLASLDEGTVATDGAESLATATDAEANSTPEVEAFVDHEVQRDATQPAEDMVAAPGAGQDEVSPVSINPNDETGEEMPAWSEWPAEEQDPAAEEAKKQPLKIGVSFPLSSAYLESKQPLKTDAKDVVTIEVLARLATDMINKDPHLLPHHHVELVEASENDESDYEIMHTYKDEGVVGMLGSYFSSTSMDLSHASRTYGVEKPMIAFGATHMGLRNKTEFPYFNRLSLNDATEVAALTTVITNYGWDKVVVMYDDMFGSRLWESFAPSLAGASVDAIGIPFRPGVEDYSETLSAIKATHRRAVVLLGYTNTATELLEQAYDAGLTGEGYAWLTSEWMVLEMQYAKKTAKSRQALLGFLGASQFVQSAETRGFREVIDTWSQLRSAEYPRDTRLRANPYAFDVYDAVFAMAHAADALVREGGDVTSGAQLLRAVREVNFVGATGAVRFDANGERDALYSVVNFRGDRFYRIGAIVDGHAIMERDAVFGGAAADPPPSEVKPRSRSKAWVAGAALSGTVFMVGAIAFLYYLRDGTNRKAVHKSIVRARGRALQLDWFGAEHRQTKLRFPSMLGFALSVFVFTVFTLFVAWSLHRFVTAKPFVVDATVPMDYSRAIETPKFGVFFRKNYRTVYDPRYFHIEMEEAVIYDSDMSSRGRMSSSLGVEPCSLRDETEGNFATTENYAIDALCAASGSEMVGSYEQRIYKYIRVSLEPCRGENCASMDEQIDFVFDSDTQLVLAWEEQGDGFVQTKSKFWRFEPNIQQKHDLHFTRRVVSEGSRMMFASASSREFVHNSRVEESRVKWRRGDPYATVYLRVDNVQTEEMRTHYSYFDLIDSFGGMWTALLMLASIPLAFYYQYHHDHSMMNKAISSFRKNSLARKASRAEAKRAADAYETLEEEPEEESAAGSKGEDLV